MANILGERIKKARSSAGVTQLGLARTLGIHPTTLNKYEKGHRVPDAALLERMARVLRCDPGWLLAGEAGEERGPLRVSEDRPPYDRLLYKEALIREIVEGLIEALREDDAVEMNPHKFARAVDYLYTQFYREDESKEVRTQKIKAMVKLVA